MMLIEQTTVPLAALPVAEFKEHLRLGTGFADDAVQDSVLESQLRAAMAAIEARTGKALIARDYLWRVQAWRDLAAQTLPVGPVSAVTGLTIVDRLGGAAVIDPSRYRLVVDLHRPRMVATSMLLPAIPVGGEAQIAFTAGFGAAWSDVPADLAQAVMLLAAHYHEARSATGKADEMPFGVAPLIERYRNVRLFGGMS